MQMEIDLMPRFFIGISSLYVYMHTIIDTTNELNKWGICCIFQTAKQIFLPWSEMCGESKS